MSASASDVLSSFAPIKIIQPKNFPQDSFIKLFNSRTRYLVIYGGGGAGKSIATAQKMIFKALKYPRSRIIVIRKWGPQLRHITFQMLIDIIDKHEIPCYVQKSEMIIRFDNGSEILCVAIVDTARAEAASRIKSLTDITDIWIEEPNDLTLDEFEMIKLRLRGEELESGYRQIILTFNPVNKTHWLYEEFNFAGKAPPGVERQHYTYEDNEFVDQAFKEYLRTGIKDKNRHKVYALGEWGELGELVYENYTDKIFGYTYDYFDVLIAGVDFGFSNSPNAFALFGMMEDSFELYVINEVYEFGTMTRDFIDSIKTQLKDYIPERMIKEIPMYCDSARPEAIEEMRRAELNVFPAKKDVLDGINTVRQFQIYVHPDCPSFLREIQGYVRQKDAKGNALEMPDKQAGFDHLCDSLRYACHSWMMSKKKQISGVVPIMGKIATRERMY